MRTTTLIALLTLVLSPYGAAQESDLSDYPLITSGTLGVGAKVEAVGELNGEPLIFDYSMNEFFEENMISLGLTIDSPSLETKSLCERTNQITLLITGIKVPVEIFCFNDVLTLSHSKSSSSLINRLASIDRDSETLSISVMASEPVAFLMGSVNRHTVVEGARQMQSLQAELMPTMLDNYLQRFYWTDANNSFGTVVANEFGGVDKVFPTTVVITNNFEDLSMKQKFYIMYGEKDEPSISNCPNLRSGFVKEEPVDINGTWVRMRSFCRVFTNDIGRSYSEYHQEVATPAGMEFVREAFTNSLDYVRISGLYVTSRGFSDAIRQLDAQRDAL